MKKCFWVILSIVLTMQICFISCIDEEKYSSDRSIMLKFSQDTVSFDTIFTTVTSVTKQVRIFNPDNEAVKIDYITLASGSNSYFRLNVDGDTSLMAKDIEIGGKDSIFVFIRCEIDVQNKNNPVLIEDSIIISFNKKRQKVHLMAYGQDAYYHNPTHTISSGNTSINYSLANEGGANSGVIVNGKNISWANDKPHVIVGTCAVDSSYILNLQSATKIYMSNNSDFWVYKDGTINATGTTSEPIVFQSVRDQERYSYLPGQWGKLWLMAGSKNNILENVLIKNATIGMVADTCVNNNPTCKLTNVRIENCSALGLYSRGASIEGKNLIVQNTGLYSVALTMGGSYEFIGCTFANYWKYNSRNKATLLLNDWYESEAHEIINRPILKADFYNTIIYGSVLEDEIEFDLLGTNTQTWQFNHCLIKSKTLTSSSKGVIACIFNQDPMFVDVTENDLHLQDTSPAIGNGDGIWNSLLPWDIFGVLRLDPPSIGAIENQNHINKMIKNRK